MHKERDSNISTEVLKKKAASGMMILGIQTIITLAILYSTNIVLYRLLTPQVFGVWVIFNFIIITVGTITSFGLCEALIQKNRSYSDKEIQGIFTVFLFAGIFFAILFYFLAPYLLALFGGKLLESDVMWFRVCVINLLILNPNTISHALLERKLDYKQVAIGDLLTLIFIQIITILLAFKNFGVGSFVLGNLTGRIISSALFYYLAPWKIGLNFKLNDLRQLLPFGINFELNNIISMVNGAILPLFVGVVAGPTAVGLVNWAGGVRDVALSPLGFIRRIVFPVCSRLQNDKEELRRIVEKIIKFAYLLSLPLLAILFSLATAVVPIIYTSRWMGGLTALYLSLIHGIFLILIMILTDVLFAMGYAKKMRNISLFWAILHWVLVVPLVLLWGYNGAVLSGIFVSLTFFIPLREVKKVINISIFKPAFRYMIFSIITAVFVYYLSHLYIIRSIWDLILESGMGFMVYVVLLLLFERKPLWYDFLVLRRLLRD